MNNYKPGDVVNGWRLNDQGTEWEPVRGGFPPTEEQPSLTQRAPRGHKVRNAVIVFGVAILVLFGGCAVLTAGVVDSVDKATTSEPGDVSKGFAANDAVADVELGKATAPELITGIVYLPVTVTNHSGKRSDYYVEVAALDATGNRVDMSNLLVSNLEPGRASIEQMIFVQLPGADITFQVIEVQRTVSP